MARRSDPERLYLAHRAGHLSRLISQGKLSPEAAEQWITAWEDEARRRGLDRRSGVFWAPAWDWIAERRGRYAETPAFAPENSSQNS
jgi:hypothetical protein